MLYTDEERQKIIKTLEDRFTEGEVRTICRDNQQAFGGNLYDNLEGDTVKARFSSLVDYLIRKNLIESFLKVVRQKEPSYAVEIWKQKQDIQKKELISILNNDFETNKKIYIRAYRSSKRKNMIAEKPTENMENIIDNLKYCEGDYCNYMKFVVYLLMIERGKLDENLYSQLGKWLDKNVKEDIQSRLREEIEEIRNRRPNPYLLLVINSKATNEYALTAWYVADYNYQSNSSDLDFKQIIWWKDDEKNNEFIINAKSSNFLSQIEDCIKKIDEQYNIDKISQIHFFVPTCLMSYNIDCCKIDNDYIIGEKNELIIRCSERINKPNSLSIRNGITRWQRKANIFQEENLRRPAVEIFTSSDDNGDGYKNFNKRLENDDTLKGVYFTNFLQNNDDYHNLLLKGGIPLALWIRQELDNINIKEALSNILRNEILLKDLPKKVMDERGKDNDISKHICLLWDDPNLLPPEQMLNQSKL